MYGSNKYDYDALAYDPSLDRAPMADYFAAPAGTPVRYDFDAPAAPSLTAPSLSAPGFGTADRPTAPAVIVAGAKPRKGLFRR